MNRSKDVFSAQRLFFIIASLLKIYVGLKVLLYIEKNVPSIIFFRLFHKLSGCADETEVACVQMLPKL